MIYYFSDNPNGFVTGKKFSIDLPCVTIMGGGMAGDSLYHWHFARDGRTETLMLKKVEKPPYRVSLMSEIAKIPWNGLTVVSTFAGCGGSSTGYRMAGYRVLLANEFVPIARDSYAANMRPGTILAGEDIRDLSGAEILKRTGLRKGELDILDGSPPCQAFSTAGKRAKGWGTDRKYDHGAKQRNEDMFFEYVRLVRDLQPRVFIAENVSGLVKGVAKGYFIDILAQLKSCGYKVEARLLDAQWLGVPQQRQRIIFIGVRDDIAALGFLPAFPQPLSHRYSLREAIPWIVNSPDLPCPTVTTGFPGNDIGLPMIEGANGFNKHAGSSVGLPMVTVQAGRPVNIMSSIDKRKLTIAELKRICAFPDDFVLKGTYAQQWERLGNSVPPVMMRHIAETVRDKILLPWKKSVTKSSAAKPGVRPAIA